MHSHNASEVNELLKNHLPHGYARKVVEKANIQGVRVSQETVRKIKTLVYADIQILNLLVELATETKAVAEAQKKKLNQILSK